MDCDKCQISMIPVGLGECNGWECPKCKATKDDLASFKDIPLETVNSLLVWEKTAIQLMKAGELKLFYTKFVKHPMYSNVTMFKCNGCKLPVSSTSSWFHAGRQWHFMCMPEKVRIARTK